MVGALQGYERGGEALGIHSSGKQVKAGKKRKENTIVYINTLTYYVT